MFIVCLEVGAKHSSSVRKAERRQTSHLGHILQISEYILNHFKFFPLKGIVLIMQQKGCMACFSKPIQFMVHLVIICMYSGYSQLLYLNSIITVIVVDKG